MEKTDTKYSFHLGIAEKGKIYAVEGNHKEALRHYKEAIRMTQNQVNGEMFFQHYIQCAMESMELMGAYDEVINYCEKFLDLLDTKEQTEIILKYKADVLQRMAVQYLFKEDKEEAKALFQIVQKTTELGRQKLTDDLLNWLLRGYNISPKQILDLQKKHHYFIVNKENLKPEIAIELPEIINHH